MFFQEKFVDYYLLIVLMCHLFAKTSKKNSEDAFKPSCFN